MDVLTPGARLGPYEVLAPLGAGGMGRVYRATDTRLDRTVAIKVLNPELSGDLASRGRFEREARSIAALSHPHICTLYDVGAHDGQAFLVMELLEGQALAGRLARVTGGIPVPEALTIATAVADALAFAHRHHIIHRDIKPANIMLTRSGAKLVDFGLARLREGDAVAANGPTQAALTEPHSVMGTLGYMSPEQLDGHADERSDVFAFGAVLFEMLTGRKPFTGDTTVKLMAAIVHEEPPSVSTLRPDLPSALDRVVQRCLSKNPDDRWQSMADLADEIRWIAREPEAVRAANVRLRSWIRWAAILVAALTIAVAALGGASVFTWFKPRVPAGTELRLEIATPRTVAPHEFALSPDGRSIAASIGGNGPAYLLVRQLQTAVTRQLDSGSFPFWSPDSNSIGYFAGGDLRRVDLIDSRVRTLASVGVPRGGSWSGDGTILFASVAGPIMRVPETGGEARAATRIELGQTAHRFPQFLPDNRHFLYYVVGNEDQRGLYLTELDGVGKRIAAADSAAAVLSNDRIIFNTQGVIAVHQLDLTRGVLVGQPQIVIQSAPINPFLALGVSVAADGTMAYRAPVDTRQLRWFDRAGTPLEIVDEPSQDGRRRTRLSPDGKRLALDRVVVGNRDVWIRELSNGATTRFTTDRALDGYPVWSPNGSQIAFLSDRNGSMDIFIKSSASTEPERELLTAPGNQMPLDWSRDGRWLLYYDGANAGDLWALPMTGDDRTPVPIAQSVFAEADAAWSPDGRWVAYPSDDSGTIQLMVQSFPKATTRRQVSVKGGLAPVWSANGKELFFVAPDGKLMVVSVQTTANTFQSSAASALFQTRIVNTSSPGNGAEYAVAPDGRILVNETVDEQPAPITVILNWRGAPAVIPSSSGMRR